MDAKHLPDQELDSTIGVNDQNYIAKTLALPSIRFTWKHSRFEAFTCEYLPHAVRVLVKLAAPYNPCAGVCIGFLGATTSHNLAWIFSCADKINARARSSVG